MHNIYIFLFISYYYRKGEKSYGDADDAPDLTIPKFRPEYTPGLHLPEDRTKSDTSKYLTPGKNSWSSLYHAFTFKAYSILWALPLYDPWCWI